MANNILNEGRDTLLKIFDEVKDLNQNELREKNWLRQRTAQKGRLPIKKRL